MRDINAVVTAMIAKVPDDFPRKEYLSQRMAQIARDDVYKAPEVKFMSWLDLSETLTVELGNPDTEWKQEIADIFGDKIKV